MLIIQLEGMHPDYAGYCVEVTANDSISVCEEWAMKFAGMTPANIFDSSAADGNHQWGADQCLPSRSWESEKLMHNW